MKRVHYDSTVFLYGLIAACLSIFVLLAPFNNALFFSINYLFEKPIFAWTVVLACTSIISGVVMVINRKQINFTELTIYGVVLLIPLSAAISHLFSITTYNSYVSILINLTAALLFIASHQLSKKQTFSTFMQTVMLGAGHLIVIHGILNVAGIAHYKSAVLLSGPIDNLNLRLNSVFQYANAYAGFLVAILLSSLYVIAHTGNKMVYGILSFMLVPTTLSLLLTGSKGGLVTLTFGMIVLLLCSNIHRQIMELTLAAVSFAASIILMYPIAKLGVEIGTNPASNRHVKVMLIIFTASLLISLILLLANSKLFPWLRLKLSSLERVRAARYVLGGAPIMMGLLGAVLYVVVLTIIPEIIPDYVRDRLGNIRSYSERALFYQDSLRMLADHVWTGIGGNSWSEAILLYKKYPYQSTQTHSFLFQYLSEYGIIGFLCVFGFIGYVFVTFIRNIRTSKQPIPTESGNSNVIYFLFAFTLLFHSLIDFTMSFVYLFLLTFISLGGMFAASSSFLSAHHIASRQLTRGVTAASVLLMVLSVFVIIQSCKIINSNNAFRESLAISEKSGSPAAALSTAKNSLIYRYRNPYYDLFSNSLLVQLYSQTKNQAYYDEALRSIEALQLKEPYKRDVLEQEYELLLSKGDIKGAYSYIEKRMADYPWDIKLYEHLVSTAYRIGNELRQQNGSEAAVWWDKSLAYYEEATTKNLSSSPVAADKPAQAKLFSFDSTDLMSLNTAIIHFTRGNYSAAEKVLKPKINYYPQNETQKGIDRWYLASLQKQNKQDMALFNQLISIDIKEKELIEQLVKP